MGPLAGVRIVELAGIGPAPMAAMLLADLGATVLRIDRAEPVDLGVQRPLRFDLLRRGRRAIALDLKRADAVALVLRLIEGADGLLEGFRPGVMERLGLGPEVCRRRNPRLVYGRMTGWGQDGPLAMSAGHDLNYIALSGALHAIGRAGQPPSVPLALLGDFAGGGLFLAFGMVAGLFEARGSGQGQVVDAAIAEGTASLATLYYGAAASGGWNAERGSNISDSGAYFYDVYRCADGEWVAVAPLEQRFFDELLRRIGVDPASLGDRADRATWPHAREVLVARFAERPRAEWCALLEGTDACFAPVLSWEEAPAHPHFAARQAFVELDGVVQPAPTPRFSRTPGEVAMPPQPITPANTRAALTAWLDAAEIEGFRDVLQLD